MPLTWFAHQAPIIGVKMLRPSSIDATALCVGSVMPDMMYSVSARLGIDTHGFEGAALAVPVAVLAAVVLRRLVANPLFTRVPDLGAFRLRSWAVISTRTPGLAATALFAGIGVVSHLLIDAFTRPGRQMPVWLGYDDIEVELLGRTESMAGVLQLIGHGPLSLAAVVMLFFVGHRRLLESWYGMDAVAHCREAEPRRMGSGVFWLVSLAGLTLGGVWGGSGEFVEQIQRPAVGLGGGLVVASLIDRRMGARPDDVSQAGS